MLFYLVGIRWLGVVLAKLISPQEQYQTSFLEVWWLWHVSMCLVCVYMSRKDM